jgi:putative glycosyltransferase (TIGR04372 family)
MNLRVIKKKFRQEVILDVDSCRNSNFVIARKFLTLCLKVLGGLVLTLVLAPISLVRPIEIWQMNTRLRKISFFIEDLETGLRDLQSRGMAGRVWILALYGLDFPNNQLALMYRRYIWILGKKQRLLAEIIRFVWPVIRVHRKRVMDRSSNKFEIWNSGKNTLAFSDSETKVGKILERELGLIDNVPFVCLTIPSKKYRELVDYKQTEHLTESKDDLFTSIPDLESYIPAIQELNSRDIGVVRMGVHEEFKLPESLGQRAIDYAFLNRSEFGDVWLSSRCLFYLTGGSGAWWFGSIFGKPAVATDFYELRGTYGSSDIFIPQLSRSIKKNCLNSFEWMIKNQQWAFDRNRLGIDYEIIKNTSRQITDVATEMVMRIQGNWNETDEDEELQKRFRLVQEKLRPADRAPARIGAKFLREHQYLLPD